MSCCNCFSLYDSKEFLPKFLTCGHDCCLGCLNKMFDRDQFIECPICELDLRVDPKSLPTASSLINCFRSSEHRNSLCKNICEYPNCSDPSYKNSFHSRRCLCEKHYHEEYDVLKRQIQCSINKAKIHIQSKKRDMVSAKQGKENVALSYQIMDNNLNNMKASIQRRQEELVLMKTEFLNSVNKKMIAMQNHVDLVNNAVSKLEQSLLKTKDSNELYKPYQKFMRLTKVDPVKNAYEQCDECESNNALEMWAPWDKILSDLDSSLQAVTQVTRCDMTSCSVLNNLSLSTEHYLKPNEENIMKGEKIPLIWCVDKVIIYRKECEPIYSPTFVTHIGGYKAQLVIYLNGRSRKYTHVSLYLRLCKCESDEKNIWPFPWSFKFGIVDQEFLSASLYSFTFSLDCEDFARSHCFEQPQSDYNEVLGHQLMDIKTLHVNDRFIRDDKLFVAVVLLK